MTRIVKSIESSSKFDMKKTNCNDYQTEIINRNRKYNILIRNVKSGVL